MQRIKLVTDAPLNEVRHPRGTLFNVVDKSPAKLADGEVDRRTAEAWLRMTWATEDKAGARSSKPQSGTGGDAG
jgi:hypothetical protein